MAEPELLRLLATLDVIIAELVCKLVVPLGIEQASITGGTAQSLVSAALHDRSVEIRDVDFVFLGGEKLLPQDIIQLVCNLGLGDVSAVEKRQRGMKESGHGIFVTNADSGLLDFIFLPNRRVYELSGLFSIDCISIRIDTSKYPVDRYLTSVYSELRRDGPSELIRQKIIEDPFDGIKDLRSQKIRFVRELRDENNCFVHNPYLVLLRALKLFGKLKQGRFISPINMTQLSKAEKQYLITQDQAILHREVCNLFMQRDPSPVFQYLMKSKLLSEIYPELFEAMSGEGIWPLLKEFVAQANEENIAGYERAEYIIKSLLKAQRYVPEEATE